MSFTHDKLDKTKDEIRVIEVSSTLVDHSVACSIRHIELTQKYSCLSYIWGSSQSRHRILVNGKFFYVGANLHRFLLYRARGPRAHEPIWIDAICINQLDSEERNYQVYLMGQIYREASEVIIWLGDTCQLSRFISEPNIQADSEPTTCLPGQMAQVKIHELRRAPENQAQLVWQGLQEICRSQYWNRIWTVQEFLLARRLLLMCGATVIEFVVFEQFAKEWLSMSHIYPHIIQHIDFFNVQRYSRQREESMNRGMKGLSLRKLILEFHVNQCSEPVDRIYAMLSLASNGQDFSIDYGEPKIELLVRTVCFCAPLKYRHLTEMTALLTQALALDQEDQTLVQDFLMHAHESSDLVEHFMNLRTTVMEAQLLSDEDLDLTEAELPDSFILGCPLDYNGDSELQSLFDFCCNLDGQSYATRFYLVHIEWLRMSLQLVCVEDQGSDYGNIIGIALEYPSQLADVVFVIVSAECLGKMQVALHGNDGISLSYEQVLTLIDWMQTQRSILDTADGDILGELHFGPIQHILFDP